MAITTFIDPFGSMVQGYKEGQQAELQRQAGRRAMRDSDYEYRLRQTQDPMRTRILNTQMDQGLFDLLTSREQAPIQTNMLQANLEGLRKQADFERQTADARIRAANMQPDAAQANIDATRSSIERQGYLNNLTQQQIDQLAFGNRFDRFLGDPMMSNPNVGIPLLTSRLIGQNFDPSMAPEIAAQMFYSGGANQPAMTQQPSQNYNAAYARILNDVQAEVPNATEDQVIAAAQQRFMQGFGGDRPFFVAQNPDGSFTQPSPEAVSEYTGVPAPAPAPDPVMPGVTPFTGYAFDQPPRGGPGSIVRTQPSAPGARYSGPARPPEPQLMPPVPTNEPQLMPQPPRYGPNAIDRSPPQPVGRPEMPGAGGMQSDRRQPATSQSLPRNWLGG